MSRLEVVYGEDEKQYVVKMGRTCAITYSQLEVTGFTFNLKPLCYGD